jgi:hypothetical protein
MRAFLRFVALALAAVVLYGGAPAHLATGHTRGGAPLADCPAGTNWNHILQICD